MHACRSTLEDPTFRLKSAGLRLIETPAAVAEHASRPRSTWLYAYQIRNRWHFILKNYEWQTLLALAPALIIHEPLQLALLIAKGESRAWLRAVAGLWTLSGGLTSDRRAVRSTRRVHDSAILRSDPLVVRQGLVRGGAGQFLKRAYDHWLAGYWRLASRLLP